MCRAGEELQHLQPVLGRAFDPKGKKEQLFPKTQREPALGTATPAESFPLCYSVWIPSSGRNPSVCMQVPSIFNGKKSDFPVKRTVTHLQASAL